MEIKQNATLTVQKGDNAHIYHVPPTASLPEVYDVLKEMLGYVYERLKADFEQTPAAPTQPAQADPAPAVDQSDAQQ